jgi:CDP-diacylglycerol--serine O-phosphatidyltransferase
MGCVAIKFCLAEKFCPIHGIVDSDNLVDATIFLGIGMLFDFADGFAARMLKVSGEMGKQLDSLADMVSFGVAPAFILYSLADESHCDYSRWQWGNPAIVQYLCLAVAAASAYRLAKFNIDERQSDSFIGLPTPSNTLIIASLPWIASMRDSSAAHYLQNPYVILAFVVICCWLPVSEWPFMALKFKNFKIKENIYKYLLILSAVILFVILQALAVPVFIIIYAILSKIETLKKNTNEI